MLSFLAYSFKDGPWKHAYVRFGYDPRAKPEAYKFQVIDIGVLENGTFQEGLVQTQRRADLFDTKKYVINFFRETYDPTFSEAPTKLRQLYQLCDLNDSPIVDILEKEKALLKRSDEISCDVIYLV